MALGRSREMKKTKVEIIPMIDTMFFLLVFFILSSLGIIKLQGINIDLPVADSASQPSKNKPTELTVTLDKDSKITVNGIPVVGRTLNIGPYLQRELAKAGPGHSDPAAASVIINADPVVKHGLVVQCIDQARQQNIKNFAIATKEDSGAADTTAPPAPATGAKQR